VKKIMLLVLVLLGTVAISRTAGQSSAQEKVKFAELHNHGDFLFAQGVWRADNLNEKNDAASDSVTELECYSHGGKQLVGSEAYCLQATALIAHGVPAIDVTYFPVIVWDRDKVLAADSSTAQFPICIWTQITISFNDHSIMATDTRKLGKGHEGFMNSCEDLPLAQTYHLMDQTAELVRRATRATKKPNSGTPKE
jgi:hypothetical protein